MRLAGVLAASSALWSRSSVLVPLALVLGIFLGGHPSPPRVARDALVSDDQAQVMTEALDIITDSYYRPVSQLELPTSLAGMVRSLHDRFSHYFSPEHLPALRAVRPGRVLGRRDSTCRGAQAGPARR